MASKKLKPHENALIKEFMSNGFNRSLAYLKIKPATLPGSARTASSKFFLQPHIKDEIYRLQKTDRSNKVSSKEYLTLRSHNIGLKAENASKLNTALRAIDQVARINGLYNQQSEEMGGYEDLLKTLVVVNGDVNINTHKETENQPIDITPKE